MYSRFIERLWRSRQHFKGSLFFCFKHFFSLLDKNSFEKDKFRKKKKKKTVYVLCFEKKNKKFPCFNGTTSGVGQGLDGHGDGPSDGLLRLCGFCFHLSVEHCHLATGVVFFFKSFFGLRRLIWFVFFFFFNGCLRSLGFFYKGFSRGFCLNVFFVMGLLRVFSVLYI